MISPIKFFETTDRFYHKLLTNLKTGEAPAVNYVRLYRDKRGPLSRIRMDRAHAKFRAARDFLFDFHDYTDEKLKYALKGARQ